VAYLQQLTEVKATMLHKEKLRRLCKLPNRTLRNLEGWGGLDIWRGWAGGECKFW